MSATPTSAPLPSAAGLRARVPRAARRAVWAAIRPALSIVGSVKGASTGVPELALTFDDGPDPDTTPGVLDALAARQARATFFLLADRATAAPALVARLVAEGHEVALHGLGHDRLTRLPAREVTERLREGRRRVEDVAGVRVRLFRPPHGAQSIGSYVATRRAGLRPVVWSADGGDWEDTPITVVADRVAAGSAAGSIVVLHDALFWSPGDAPPPGYDRGEMVGAVVDRLRDGGLESVTVSELLRLGPSVRSFWFRD